MGWRQKKSWRIRKRSKNFQDCFINVKLGWSGWKNYFALFLCTTTSNSATVVAATSSSADNISSIKRCVQIFFFFPCHFSLALKNLEQTSINHRVSRGGGGAATTEEERLFSFECVPRETEKERERESFLYFITCEEASRHKIAGRVSAER